MNHKVETYAKAVKIFVDVINNVRAEPAASGRRLSERVKVPTATGQRIITSLEKHGWLLRDSSTGIVAGLEARRIGFRAWGAGDIADICSPILNNLRHRTNITAFLGFRGSEKIQLGAFSFGRGHLFCRSEYDILHMTIDRLNQGDFIFCSLGSRAENIIIRSTCFAPLMNLEYSTDVVVGLLASSPNFSFTSQHLIAITEAIERFSKTDV